MKIFSNTIPHKKNKKIMIATPMTICHTIPMEAKELKQMRVNARMTIAQAAGYALVSPRTWARWESGKVNIPERGVRLFELIMEHNHHLQEEGSNHGKT